MTKWLAAVLLVVLAACGSSHDRTLHGSVALTDTPAVMVTGRHCVGGVAGLTIYLDLHPGAEVRVTDGDGHLRGLGKLSAGSQDPAKNCIFPFTVHGVKPADFYVVRVAGRDGPTYTARELDKRNWSVRLALGG